MLSKSTRKAIILFMLVLLSESLPAQGGENIPSGGGILTTTFSFLESELPTCDGSKRFSDFLLLAKSLKEKVSRIEVRGDERYASCRAKVAAHLKRLGYEPIESEETDTLLKIELLFTPRQKEVAAVESTPSLEPLPTRKPPPIVHMQSKTIISGGLGGGLGYGHEIPGEEMGKRQIALLGVEAREVWQDFGVKLDGSYSYSKESVVPNTFTGRAAVFYEFATAESFSTRVAGGVEFFQTKIKQAPKDLKIDKEIFVPEQVVAPLVILSMQSLLRERWALGAHLYATPLYLPEGGFFPSYSPFVDAGYKFSKDLILSLAVGRENHVYPNVGFDSRLHMDVMVLNIKKGLK